MQRVMAPYRNAGFFVLRTPLLPLRSFFELSDEVTDKQRMPDAELAAELAVERRRVLDVLSRARGAAAVREALFVASPDLHDAIEELERGALGEEAARKAIAALYRYLARMSTRSTPFGLFAGSSIGRLESRTDLHLAGRDAYRRFTLLDNSYLFLLLDELNADPACRVAAVYRPNSGLYRAGEKLRYAETLVDREAGTMGYQLASVDRDECIDLALEIARGGTTVAELAGRLAGACGVTLEEATAYVDRLIDDQILVSELGLAVTGSTPLEDACGLATSHAPALSDVRAGLEELDGAGLGVARESYQAIIGVLERLPVRDIEPSRVFHVDLWKPLAGESLGSQVVSDVRAVVAQLARIAAPLPRTELDRLRDAFTARYGEESVPLTEALDPDLGIAADRPSIASEATGLLDRLTFDEPDPADRVEHLAIPDRDLHLLGKLREAWSRGDHEIVLDEADLAKLETPLDRRAALPPSFAAWFQLARQDSGHEILFSAAVGPPSTRLLGRFAHGSARLTGLLRQLAEMEARGEPDAILAEIAHLPEGRSGNVVCRPTVREFEIPYLGKSGVARDKQIAVDDLWLRVVDGRFELRSRSLGRRVLPRLSCAHNTARNSAPLYRFLAQLQFQGCHAWLKWSWGAFLHAPHLPRVRIGPVIVSRETWNLGRAELQPLADRSPLLRYRHVAGLRERFRLPRHVSLADGDNEMPVDLENPVGLDVLADLVKSRARACLVELWPGPGRAGVEGPEGTYANEVILPFVRSAADAVAIRAPASPRIAADRAWMRSRLTTSRSAVDPLLAAVAREMARLVGEGACELWHFQTAPEQGGWQIALDLGGDRDRLIADAIPALGRALAPLLRGQLRAWTVDAGGLDGERFGGEPAIREVHEIMAHDSAAALELLELLAGDDEERWRLALASAHHLPPRPVHRCRRARRGDGGPARGAPGRAAGRRRDRGRARPRVPVPPRRGGVDHRRRNLRGSQPQARPGLRQAARAPARRRALARVAGARGPPGRALGPATAAAGRRGPRAGHLRHASPRPSIRAGPDAARRGLAEGGAVSAWQPIITDPALAARAEEIVLRTAQFFDPRVTDALPPPRLQRFLTRNTGCEGVPAVAVFFAYLALERWREEWVEAASTWLDRAVDVTSGLDEPGPWLSSGIAGCAWAISHILPRLGAPHELADEDPNQEVDQALAEFLAGFRGSIDAELVLGLSGLGTYYLESLARESSRDGLAVVVDQLREQADPLPNGFAWRKPLPALSHAHRIAHPDGLYNLGIPHGAPGVIAFLARVCAGDAASGTARELLEGAVAWLLDQRSPSGASLFPCYVDPRRGPVEEESRLAWCYGDLAIASAVLQAARALDRPDWELDALVIAERAAARPRASAGVEDGMVCHGAAGLAHMFNRMYQASGRACLRAAALRWYQATVDYYDPSSCPTGYRCLVREQTDAPTNEGPIVAAESYGVAVGVVGVALALLAGLGRVTPDWDRVLATAIDPEVADDT